MSDFESFEDQTYRQFVQNGYFEAEDDLDPDPVKDHSLSLIVPIYNEENHLKRFLSLLDKLEVGIKKEIIFVDDFSKDKSLAIIKSYNFTTASVKIIQHEENKGKGAAIQTGLEHTSSTIIGVQDADFEYRMSDIPKLIKPLIENKCDVIYGSRYKKSAVQIHRTYHYLVNRLLTTLSNLLSGLYLTDMETCYKFFKADIIKSIKIESNRFGFEPEITAKIARLKLRIFELPISYHPRNYEQGKKITWKDGIAAFYHIVRFNLFSNKKNSYLEALPKKYMPKGSQLL